MQVDGDEDDAGSDNPAAKHAKKGGSGRASSNVQHLDRDLFDETPKHDSSTAKRKRKALSPEIEELDGTSRPGKTARSMSRKPEGNVNDDSDSEEGGVMIYYRPL